MVLDYHQNFISALEDKLMELDQISVYWDCYTTIFQIYNMVMALCCCQNLVSAHYLVNKLMVMEFDQILHMH